jgi:hypothetical protein
LLMEQGCPQTFNTVRFVQDTSGLDLPKLTLCLACNSTEPLYLLV